MRRTKRKKRAANDDVLGPTPEQIARQPFALSDVLDNEGGGTRRIGKAYRKVRMVELLERRETITADQAKALRHYRHHADMADRSPLRDSLNQQRGGSGCGPTIAMLNAMRVASEFEAVAGSLQGMLRAVVVDDVSLDEWTVLRRQRREQTSLEMRYLAGIVASELAA